MNPVMKQRWSWRGFINTRHDDGSPLAGMSYQRRTDEIMNRKARFFWVFHPIKSLKRSIIRLIGKEAK